MLNVINCKPKMTKIKKLKSFNFLTTEKIIITNITVGAKTKLERHKLECENMDTM